MIFKIAALLFLSSFNSVIYGMHFGKISQLGKVSVLAQPNGQIEASANDWVKIKVVAGKRIITIDGEGDYPWEPGTIELLRNGYCIITPAHGLDATIKREDGSSIALRVGKVLFEKGLIQLLNIDSRQKLPARTQNPVQATSQDINAHNEAAIQHQGSASTSRVTQKVSTHGGEIDPSLARFINLLGGGQLMPVEGLGYALVKEKPTKRTMRSLVGVCVIEDIVHYKNHTVSLEQPGIHRFGNDIVISISNDAAITVLERVSALTTKIIKVGSIQLTDYGSKTSGGSSMKTLEQSLEELLSELVSDKAAY